jgi:type II secretory pathway pseudopilin PulG
MELRRTERPLIRPLTSGIQARTGFTLLELLLLVAIMAIAVA